MEESSLAIYSYSHHEEEEATQVVSYNHDYYFNFGNTDEMELYASSSGGGDRMKMEAENEKKTDGLDCDDFSFPEIPNDEDDDFSWLFKILPPETPDQTVPTGESSSFEQTNHQTNPSNENKTSPEKSKSMLLDTFFSELDVTSLISPAGADIKVEINKSESSGEIPAGESEQRKRTAKRKAPAKRPALLRGRGPEMITDTPVSLRRSQRKRSYQQMIDAEVSIDQCPSSKLETVDHGKRRRVEEKQSDSSPDSSPPKKIEHGTIGNELKIILRKHKPVNPIDRKLINNRSYQRGLLDPIKILAGELYLKHSISPQVVPIPIPEVEGIVPSIIVDKPLDPKKIKDLLRIEWIENHNTIANAKAHGNEVLGSSGLIFYNGNSLQGRFLTMDLDNEYENILREQNSFQSVINWKEKLANQAIINSELEKSVNLESTFSNFSNFNNYFDDDDEDSQLDEDDSNVDTRVYKKRTSGITGAVPINANAISSKLFDKWNIFRLKGHYFRPNPPVVILQRIPDEVIEEMKSKPKRVTLESTYYNALTSYFDKRSV